MDSLPIRNRLHDELSRIPVIDCHEHLGEPGPTRSAQCRAFRSDPLMFLCGDYLGSDLQSAGASSRDLELLLDPAASLDAKWAAFEPCWTATEHTAYARATKRVLKRYFGVDRLTRDALDRIAQQLDRSSDSRTVTVLQDAGVRAVITDVLRPQGLGARYFHNPELADFLEGRYVFPHDWKPVFWLSQLHEVQRREFVDFVAQLAGADITSLDRYEAATFEVLKRGRQKGIVALKDQSAYVRDISYVLPTRGDAERLFNRILSDPRQTLGWPESKALGDYLFHSLLRHARELDLPVQIHTGHLADIRNRVDKANAALLAPALELHTQVRFDLFHGNWPYLGDLLFLAKNYPNVSVNLCWLHIVDPLYAQELMKRAVVTVPHTKLHGFGGDFAFVPELSVASLEMARENMAAALADLVEMGWIDESTAVSLAADWLYNNPNAFFRLGLPSVQD
jgi:uncharacterized protein